MPRYEEDGSPPHGPSDRRAILPPVSESRGRMRSPPPIPMHQSSRRSHRDPDLHRDYSPGVKQSHTGSSSVHYRDYDDMYPPPPPLPPPAPRSLPYKILCVANLNSKVSDSSIRDALIREFTRFGEVSVKVTHDANERFAYIYFRCYEDAREARHAKCRMVLFDKSVEIDPIYERPVVSSSSTSSRSRRSLTPDYGQPLPVSSHHTSSRRLMSPSAGSSSHSRTRPYPSPSSSSSSRPLVDRHGVPYSTSLSSHRTHSSDYGRDVHHQQQHSTHHSHHHSVPREDYPPVRSSSSSSSNHHHHHHHSSVSAGVTGGNGNSMHTSSSNNNSTSNNNNNGSTRDAGGSNGSGRVGGSSGDNKALRDSKKEKFPNYLHHIPPEEDDKATRTLFVGNLEVSISEPDLKRIFERYGTVEDIDVKRPPPGQGNAYAFIKYQNLDMAHRSKVEMSGQYIGKFQCKIGYGKATPTTRIWVGGLGSWTSLSALEREFDRFGAIRKIDFVRGDNHAYISYDSIDAAQAACQEMRGFPLGGADKRLRVDFADPGPYNSFDGTPPPNSATSPSAVDVIGGLSATRVVLPGEKFVDPDLSVRGGLTDGETEGRIDRSSHRSSGGSAAPAVDPFSDASGGGGDVRDRSNGTSGSQWAGGADITDRKDQRKSRSIHSPDMQPPAKRMRDQESIGTGRSLSTSSSGDVKGESVDDGRSILVSESVTSLSELAKCCPTAWTGALILKNSAFPAKMLLCSGNVSLVDLLMKSADQQPQPLSSPSSIAGTESGVAMPVLRITQRLRLDPAKLDDVLRRMSSAGGQGQCILLVTRAPNSAQLNSSTSVLGEDGNGVVQRPLKNLVHYLKQKEAAGVIPLTSSPPASSSAATSASPAAVVSSVPGNNTSASSVKGSLYAFPPCAFATDLIQKIAPNFVDSDSSKEEYLLVVVIRGSR